MTRHQPDFTAELDAIAQRRTRYLRTHDHAYRRDCCSAHASADDVERLLQIVDQLTDERDHLRAALHRQEQP